MQEQMYNKILEMSSWKMKGKKDNNFETKCVLDQTNLDDVTCLYVYFWTKCSGCEDDLKKY